MREVEIAIKIDYLCNQLNFFVDVEVERQFDAIVGEGSAILNKILCTKM